MQRFSDASQDRSVLMLVFLVARRLVSVPLPFPSDASAGSVSHWEGADMTDKRAQSRRKALETQGQRLKAGVLAEFELSAAEAATLDQAAELLDQLTRINDELAKQPLTTAGSRGQVAAHPLLRSAREHSDTLARLLDALHFPAGDEEQGESSVTRLARRAAMARWSREEGA
jgi:hypothetical protein